MHKKIENNIKNINKNKIKNISKTLFNILTTILAIIYFTFAVFIFMITVSFLVFCLPAPLFVIFLICGSISCSLYGFKIVRYYQKRLKTQKQFRQWTQSIEDSELINIPNLMQSYANPSPESDIND